MLFLIPATNSEYHLNDAHQELMNVLKIAGDKAKPKGNLLYLNNPIWVLITKNFWLSSFTSTCKYAFCKSIFENKAPCPMTDNSSSILGSGYLSTEMSWFSSLKSAQILMDFPSSFKTGTIGAVQ